MRLYPRLARRFAHDAFTKQTNLDLHELADTADTTHPLMTWPATGAVRVSPAELTDLRTEIIGAATQHGWPEALSQDAQRAVDLRVARLLWEHANLTPAEAGFGDVWSFLALVLLPDLVWWRAAGSTNEERFVATDLTRHTLARLWWRAQLFTHGLDDPEEGWELWRSSEIGEADLDQIQTRRGGYGRSPKAFRALVRVYPRFTELAAAPGVDRRTLWRDQYLRWLLRLGAFTNFTGLTEEQINRDFADLAHQIEPVDLDRVDQSTDEPPNVTIDGVKSFDEIPLATVVVYLAQAVRAHGQLPDAELYDAFETITGINVPTNRRDIVHGIAWQGLPLNYLAHGDEAGVLVWRPGTVLPAPDRRWGEWSIAAFKQHVAAESGEPDPARLAAELFAGRPGRTVRRIVRAAMQDARRPH